MVSLIPDERNPSEYVDTVKAGSSSIANVLLKTEDRDNTWTLSKQVHPALQMFY